MHRQASFFSGSISEGTPFADGSVDAVDVFYLPSEDDNRPILGAGSWAAASADRPEVWVGASSFWSEGAAFCQWRYRRRRRRFGHRRLLAALRWLERDAPAKAVVVDLHKTW